MNSPESTMTPQSKKRPPESIMTPPESKERHNNDSEEPQGKKYKSTPLRVTIDSEDKLKDAVEENSVGTVITYRPSFGQEGIKSWVILLDEAKKKRHHSLDYYSHGYNLQHMVYIMEEGHVRVPKGADEGDIIIEDTHAQPEVPTYYRVRENEEGENVLERFTIPADIDDLIGGKKSRKTRKYGKNNKTKNTRRRVKKSLRRK